MTGESKRLDFLPRACAACEQEFGLRPQPGSSHGFCKRHFLAFYEAVLEPQELATILAMESAGHSFCADLAERRAAA